MSEWKLRRPRPLSYRILLELFPPISAELRRSTEGVAELSAWFADYQAKLWDEQIERDLDEGRLDALLEEVDAAYEAGKARPLSGEASCSSEVLAALLRPAEACSKVGGPEV